MSELELLIDEKEALANYSTLVITSVVRQL